MPCTPELNLPLWELGHIGWFADWWIARNPQLGRGLQADPLVARSPARQAARGVDAEALYDSSAIAHDRRWQLDLPDAEAMRADLSASLDQTLALLSEAPEDDTGLYFFRLALFHEDMHAEAGGLHGADAGHRRGPSPRRPFGLSLSKSARSTCRPPTGPWAGAAPASLSTTNSAPTPST